MTTDGDDGATGVSPDAAFAVLGNDTRVDILLALWDAFESGRGDAPLSYSTLFERVDIADSGNFSYHLEQLTGRFVRCTEGGYALKQTGINVVRAVIAGTVTADPSFGPDPIDVDCPICGAQIEVAYADEFLRVTCTDCEGRVRWTRRRPDTGGHPSRSFTRRFLDPPVPSPGPGSARSPAWRGPGSA